MSPLPSPPLEEILKAADSLPPFPDVVWKVMPLIQRMAPVEEIEAVIKFDQATTARILSLSRSPAFARRQSSVHSLQDAIMALGQQQLVQVVLTACSARYFEGEIKGYDLREGELWKHAVATALMAQLVARNLNFKKTFTVYTAALLHDIGKNTLNFYLENYFDAVLGMVRDKGIRFIDAEREILGIDHQQLGGMIAQRWRFPPDVISAISCHHNPTSASEHRDIASIVYVANRMVSAIGIGCGVDGFLQPNEDDVFLDLGITAKMVDKFLVDILDAVEETTQFLSS